MIVALEAPSSSSGPADRWTSGAGASSRTGLEPNKESKLGQAASLNDKARARLVAQVQDPVMPVPVVSHVQDPRAWPVPEVEQSPTYVPRSIPDVYAGSVVVPEVAGAPLPGNIIVHVERNRCQSW